MTTKFPPLSNPASFANIVVERIAYRTGTPRNYRFNAKRGTLNYEDQEAITTTGSTFSLIPLAFRIFSAPLFKGDHRDWVELFFLNQSGHLCGLLFHSSSVDRLEQAMARDLFYEDLSLLDCVLTVRPISRTHEKYGPYYVADFLFEPLPEAAAQKAAAIRATLSPIFRADTVTEEKTIHQQEGYRTEAAAPSPLSTATQNTGTHSVNKASRAA